MGNEWSRIESKSLGCDGVNCRYFLYRCIGDHCVRQKRRLQETEAKEKINRAYPNRHNVSITTLKRAGSQIINIGRQRYLLIWDREDAPPETINSSTLPAMIGPLNDGMDLTSLEGRVVAELLTTSLNVHKIDIPIWMRWCVFSESKPLVNYDSEYTVLSLLGWQMTRIQKLCETDPDFKRMFDATKESVDRKSVV